MILTPLQLKPTTVKDRAKDVEKLRGAITRGGYVASDADIEAAYARWSASLPNKPAWHPVSYLQHDTMLEALLSQLEPAKVAGKEVADGPSNPQDATELRRDD